MSTQCRVLNSGKETVARGACDLNEERGQATVRPSPDTGLIDKATGPLFLEMEDGRTFELASKYLRFRLYGADGERQSVYRMRLQTCREVERSASLL